MPEIDEPISLSEYDEGWPALFRREFRRLQAGLGVEPDMLEHIGSTAVPGLRAKPIIDIMLGVARLPPAPKIHSALLGLGYEALGEAGVRGRYAYRLRAGGYGINVHVVERNAQHWRANIAFRDFLRSDRAACEEYGRAKLAAIEGGAVTLLAYSGKKSELVATLVAKAKAKYECE